MADCEKCGKRVPEASPRGLCPVCCLIGLGVGGDVGEMLDGDVPGVELGVLIGAGSFGEVYAGLEAEAGFRKVAVKVLKSEVMGGAQRARFLEETQILASLKHENIARLLRGGRMTDGRPFYVMEFVDGVTLNHWVAGKSMREKVGVLCQVAEAVTHAHQKGVAHRDLKPGNVLVDQEGVVKVIDFGIARAFEGPASWGREMTGREERMGTPLYMSPEQLSGSAEVDLRSDVWSMGLFLYEVVLGEPVLDGVVSGNFSWNAILERLRSFTFPRIRDQELDWIGRKACALKVEDRYQTGAAFLADLRAWEKGEVVSVGMSYSGYRVRKWMKRHPSKLLLLTATILCAAVLLVSGWLNAVKDRERLAQVSAARELAERAEMETRREASDTALLAAAQAMGDGDYLEARTRLTESLRHWPDNEEARFAEDFLRTTRPLAISLKKETVKFSPVEVEAISGGGFRVTDAEGKLHELHYPGRESWKNGKMFQAVEARIGCLEFYLRDTGEEVMAPLIYGAGRARAAFSADQGLVLVTQPRGIIEWWDVSSMSRGFEYELLEEPAQWLEFERESANIWLIDGQGMREWAADGELGWPLGIGAGFIGNSRWEGGEGISRGLPSGTGGLKVMLHLAAWKLMDRSRQVTGTAVPREADEFLIMGNEGMLGRQRKNGFFDKVEGRHGIGHRLAVEAQGRLALVTLKDGTALLIDVPAARVFDEFQVGKGVTSVVILDGAKEAVIAYEDGFARVWNLESQKIVREIGVAGGEIDGGRFYVRSVVGKREFLTTVEGDLEIRRFSVETGEQIGRGLRHRDGVWFFFCSINEDLVFSVDQPLEGGAGGVVRVWSLRLGRELLPGLKHDSPILWVTVLDGGRRIATSTADGHIRRWVVPE